MLRIKFQNSNLMIACIFIIKQSSATIMNSEIIANRRNNLLYLIRRYGSQSRLGRKLKKCGLPQLSQATISDIVRPKSKRELSQWEARKIEEILVIPDRWMDKEGWIRSGWSLIEYSRNLDEYGRRRFKQTITLVEERLKTKPDGVLTTFCSYGATQESRQADIFKQFKEPRIEAASPNVAKLTKAIVIEMVNQA